MVFTVFVVVIVLLLWLLVWLLLLLLLFLMLLMLGGVCSLLSERLLARVRACTVVCRASIHIILVAYLIVCAAGVVMVCAHAGLGSLPSVPDEVSDVLLVC